MTDTAQESPKIKRVVLLGALGLLVFAAVLYSVYWRVQADTLAARLDRANGGEILPGIVFTFADKKVTGYPLTLDAALSGVTLAHRGMDGETAWRSENLSLHVMSYGQPVYRMEAPGLQSFARPPLRAGEVPRVTFLTPKAARASASVNNGRIEQLDIDLTGAQGKDATLGAPPGRTFSAAQAQLHLQRQSENAVAVVLSMDNAKIGGGFAPVFGGDIQHIGLNGQLSHSDVLAGFERGNESFADAAAAWRAARGALGVEGLTLKLGALATTMKGALGLDDRLDPSGTLAGAINPAELAGSLLGGTFDAPQLGPLILSLTFEKGDIEAKAALAPAGASR